MNSAIAIKRKSYNPISLCFDLWVTSGKSPIRLEEFKDDFSKFILVGRMLRGFKARKKINLRLLLNYIVVLYNTFGLEITEVFFLMSDDDIWGELKTLLDYLGLIAPSQIVTTQDGDIIDLTTYAKNDELLQLLETI